MRLGSWQETIWSKGNTKSPRPKSDKSKHFFDTLEACLTIVVWQTAFSSMKITVAMVLAFEGFLSAMWEVLILHFVSEIKERPRDHRSRTVLQAFVVN